jgi:hypothetical protein
MTKEYKTEQPPWRPQIEEPVPFHTGVPPRDLIGEVLDPKVTLDETEVEVEMTAEPAPKPVPVDAAPVGAAPVDPACGSAIERKS